MEYSQHFMRRDTLFPLMVIMHWFCFFLGHKTKKNFFCSVIFYCFLLNYSVLHVQVSGKYIKQFATNLMFNFLNRFGLSLYTVSMNTHCKLKKYYSSHPSSLTRSKTQINTLLRILLLKWKETWSTI